MIVVRDAYATRRENIQGDQLLQTDTFSAFGGEDRGTRIDMPSGLVCFPLKDDGIGA
jgi:hypothetical protein